LDNELVIEVEPGRFEEMVVTALDGLPEELGQLMRNVAMTVEHRRGPPGLLGPGAEPGRTRPCCG
jgi:predicted Zn-dependent protease with MMP-like domain